MEKLITLENVTKSYNADPVLDRVSLDLYKGEAVAFTGHNGCGKSTLLKLLAGLIRASGGKVIYHGKLRISYVPEKFPAMDIRMKDYLCSVAGMEAAAPSASDGLVRDFFLDSMSSCRLNELSKGSLQKVGVIQALLTPADVILLDEPLSGQDAASQDVFIEKINALRRQGVTLFMSCHEKKLIDALCDKEYRISGGKVLPKDSEKDSCFKIFVKKNDHLTPRAEMTDHGNRYMLPVSGDALKETVLELYSEGWELNGIEESI